MLALLVSKFSMRTRIEVLVLDAGACDWTHCGLRARTVAIFGERGCYAQVARTAEELPWSLPVSRSAATSISPGAGVVWPVAAAAAAAVGR